jgi:Ca2+-binding RTX toxin-like protein
VSARAGNDVVFAGTGNDRVDGSDGNDLVAAGGGDDLIRGQNGSDLLAGNEGADRIRAGTGSDVVLGGGGADELFGESGNDAFIFTDDGRGNGFDQVDGGSGTDLLRLRVSASVYDSSDFQAELQAYSSALAATPGSAFTFNTLDLGVTGVERVEVQVAGKTVFSAGHAAVPQSPTLAALLHDADLWGLV